MIATRTSSNSGDRLRNLARKVLEEGEYSKLKQALKNFSRTKSMETLCFQLLELFDEPKKVDLLVEIRQLLPRNQRPEFTTSCREILKRKNEVKRDIKNYSNGCGKERKRRSSILETQENCENQAKNAQSSPSKKAKADGKIQMRRKSSRLENLMCVQTRQKKTAGDAEGFNIEPKICKNRNADITSKESRENGANFEERRFLDRGKVDEFTARNRSDKAQPVSKFGTAKDHHRMVSIERPSLSTDFGFRIQGGIQQGCDITVGEVSKGSLAELHGLRNGDRIICINEIHCKQTKQCDVVKLIRRESRLRMRVVSMVTPSEHPGKVNDSEQRTKRKDSLPKGTKKITIRPGGDGWLGCSIRGWVSIWGLGGGIPGWNKIRVRRNWGTDYLCDIHVMSVDDGSPADCAGVRVGNILLEVNGSSVREMTHVQVVRQIVTASPPVVFTVKSKAITGHGSHPQYTCNRAQPPTSANGILASSHRRPSYQEPFDVPPTPLRVHARHHSPTQTTTPPQSPTFSKHHLPGYPYKLGGPACHCTGPPVCSPSSISFDALKLNQTPPPPYTEVLPSKHRLLAKGDISSSPSQDVTTIATGDDYVNIQQQNAFSSSSHGSNTDAGSIASKSNQQVACTATTVENNTENFCPMNKEHSGRQEETVTSKTQVFDNKLEADSASETMDNRMGNASSLLSQIRAFRKEKLKQVTVSSEVPQNDHQTGSQFKIQSPDFCSDITDKRRASSSSRKSDAHELLNALNQAMETRAQAMNRSLDSDDSDANGEDWDL